MTIRHLKIFLAVAKTGSMSQAASEFFISQPTVSQAIAELEEHYRTRLFERLSRRLYITPQGEQLRDYAHHVIAGFDELEENMNQLRQRQLLRMGASVTVGTCLMNPIIDRLEQASPQVEVRVCVDNTAVIEEKLLRGELDLALVEGTIHSPKIQVTPAIEDYLVLVCSSEHPFAKEHSVSLEQLSREPLIERETGSGTRELFETYLTDRQMSFTPAWVCSNSEAIKNAVLHNRGISVISIRLVEQEVRNGRICVVPVHDSATKSRCVWRRDFSLAIHQNKYHSPAVTAMLEAIRHYPKNEFTALFPNKSLPSCGDTAEKM